MSESRTENVAVLFTDVEGSTTYFKVHGDSAGRELLLEHHSMVSEAVERHNGVSVKTIGDSVLAYFSEPVGAVQAAIAIQDSIGEHQNGRRPEEQIRIRIAIHYGSVILEQNDIFGDVVNWASKLTHLTPGGDICVSRQMLDQLKEKIPWTFEPLTLQDPDITAEKGAFRVLRNGRPASSQPWPDLEDTSIPGEFRYRKQLVEGPCRPCFYCGSGRHRVSQCPSKGLPEITGAFEKLGYMSAEDINLLFSEYLKRGCPEHESPVLIAHHAFYDLRRASQLRFFRCVWDGENKSWSEVSRNMPSGSRWGAAWLAQDCIRVSNYDKAESSLAEPGQEGQTDYKIHCVSGFLNLERGFMMQALAAFSTALRCTRSPVERMFVLFILDRMAMQMPAEESAAKDWLNEILIADRWCSEAVYLDILRAFRKGNSAPALRKLEKLIRDDREYYSVAFIDPELLDNAVEVTLMLNGLTTEAKDRAAALVPNAAKALAWLEKSFGEDNESVKAAGASWSRMQDLMKKNGYFSFLDAIQCGDDICSSYDRELKSQKRLISAGFEALERRLDACSGYIRKHKEEMRNDSFEGDIKALGEKMKHLHSRSVSSDPSTIREALTLTEAMKRQMEDMEHRLKTFEKKRCLKNFGFRFLQSAAVVMVAAILVAFVLIPILWHAFQGIESMLQIDIGSAQKGLLIVSLVGGCGLSLLSALKALYDE